MNRTERLTLTGGNSSPTRILAASGCQGWRLIEAWSENGRPWELRLAWTLGNGSGSSARISVSSAVRVSVFAEHLQLDALNRSTDSNKVGVAVVNGQVATANAYDEWHQCNGIDAVALKVPPFAQRFDLQLQDRRLLATTSVKLIGGQGEFIELKGDAIPASGLAIGSIDSIQVLTSVSMQLRAIFYLGL